jgi:hypothetical protein
LELTDAGLLQDIHIVTRSLENVMSDFRNVNPDRETTYVLLQDMHIGTILLENAVFDFGNVYPDKQTTSSFVSVINE